MLWLFAIISIVGLAQNTTKHLKYMGIGGKTKCVKMNETLNQWKAL